MLFDIGWPELLLIGVVALVVIGPKDLPSALRVAGYWVRRARTLSREFQSSVDQMIREAELDEMRQELKKATDLNFEHEFQKTIDPDGSLAESIKPPDIPDHFDTTAPETVALTEDQPSLPGLLGPSETPLPDHVATEAPASEAAELRAEPETPPAAEPAHEPASEPAASGSPPKP